MNISNELIEKGKEIINSPDFKNHIKSFLKENEQDKPFKLFIDEEIPFDNNIVEKFVIFCLEFLQIPETKDLKVVLSSDKEKFATYAFYDLEKKIAAVYCTGRAIIDCMRSLAHELVHYKQDLDNGIHDEQKGDENDGVPIENEANAKAGIIMRKFGRLHPELY